MKIRFAAAAALLSGSLAAQSLQNVTYTAVSDTSLVEPSSGSAAASFAIGVTSHTEAVTVSYATADGTAVSGTDYASTAGSVTFEPGEYVKTVTVDVFADATQSGNEAFTLVLTSISSGAIARATGTCTVVLSASGLRGDANSDGKIDVVDVFYITGFLFAGGPAPVTVCAGDANGDGVIDLRDVFFLVDFLFANGPVPSPSTC